MSDQTTPGPDAGNIQNTMPKAPVGTVPPGNQTPQATVTTPPSNDAVETGGSEQSVEAQVSGEQRISRGEPLASANARAGMMRNPDNAMDVLAGVAPAPPLHISRRLHANEDEDYHYHWFGDDPMRVEYATALGYEFADSKGNGVEDSDKAARLSGLVRMRVPRESYRRRKDRINRVINPRAERAAREQFLATGESLDQDIDPKDLTRTRRGPFSQEVRRHESGLLAERERDR